MEENVKTKLLCLCLSALCNLSLLAQTGKHPRILHTTEKSAIHVPPQEAPADLEKIYSNLYTATDLYDEYDGWTVSGPNSSVGTSFIAIPFTPKSDSHVSVVRVPVHYVGSGANRVNLSLYADAGGTPGTLLAGPVTVADLALWGTCCTLTVASFSPVAVTGGTQYWVAADTPLTGNGSDFFGTWDFVAPGLYLTAGNRGDGWPPLTRLTMKPPARCWARFRRLTVCCEAILRDPFDSSAQNPADFPLTSTASQRTPPNS
jgi:hypothetical protein